MCRAPHEGQSSLVLQLNARIDSCSQVGQTSLVKPMIASHCASWGSGLLVGQNNLLCAPQVAAFTSIFQYFRVPTLTRTAFTLFRFTK